MTLVERTKAMCEEMDSMMEACMDTVGGIDGIKNMDDDSLLMFKRMLKLMDTAKEYQLEMAAKLDRIDTIEKKLDKIIALAP